MSQSKSSPPQYKIDYWKREKQKINQIKEKIFGSKNVREEYPAEYQKLLELFERHEKYPEKFHGMSNISCEKVRGGYKLWLMKWDSAENREVIFDDVSTNNCLTKKCADKVDMTMRLEIAYQKYEFKDGAEKICVICGDTRADKLQVDHVRPLFKELKRDFMIEIGQAPKNIDDVDDKFISAWKIYHQKHATYRILCQRCNNKTYSSGNSNIQV